MTEIKPGNGFPHAAKPYDPADVIPGSPLRTYSYPGGTKMADKKYRLVHDIVITAGAEVTIDGPGTQVRYETDHVSVKIAITPDITAEWAMDLEEALEQGIVEEVPPEGGEAA